MDAKHVRKQWNPFFRRSINLKNNEMILLKINMFEKQWNEFVEAKDAWKPRKVIFGS